MPNTLTERKHAGEFAVSLCDPAYCNEQISVLSGQDSDAGQVVGKVTLGRGNAGNVWLARRVPNGDPRTAFGCPASSPILFDRSTAPAETSMHLACYP